MKIKFFFLISIFLIAFKFNSVAFSAEFDAYDEFFRNLVTNGEYSEKKEKLMTFKERFIFENFTFQNLAFNFPENDESNLNGENDDEEYVFDATKLLEELDGKDNRGIESGDEKSKFNTENEKIPEYVFNDKNGNIRRFGYDNEQMTALTDEEKTQVVSVYKNKIKRKTFDSNYRLSKVEIFDLSSNAKSLKLISNRDYFYEDDVQNQIFGSVPVKASETLPEKKSKTESTFNPKGLLLSYSEFELDDKGKEFPKKRTTKSYVDDEKIASEENETWFYKSIILNPKAKKEEQLNSLKLEEKYSVKKVYSYTEKSPSPDFKYYEDGELRIERKYSSEKNYSETTYFEGGFSVQADYENAVKIFETIYFEGKEVRRKIFDTETDDETDDEIDDEINDELKVKDSVISSEVEKS